MSPLLFATVDMFLCINCTSSANIRNKQILCLYLVYHSAVWTGYLNDESYESVGGGRFYLHELLKVGWVGGGLSLHSFVTLLNLIFPLL